MVGDYHLRSVLCKHANELVGLRPAALVQEARTQIFSPACHLRSEATEEQVYLYLHV